MAWRLTVKGSFHVRGRGLIATGDCVADGEPTRGAVTLHYPDGSEAEGYAAAFERFAISNWWRHRFGVLLRGMESIPLGTIIDSE
jgi:hypothetical protein